MANGFFLRLFCLLLLTKVVHLYLVVFLLSGYQPKAISQKPIAKSHQPSAISL
jgi:hypothetical protein